MRIFDPSVPPSAALSAFDADRAPKWYAFGEADIFQSGMRQHLLDFGACESLFKRGAEPIVSVGPHDVEITVTVGFQRYGKRRKAQPLHQGRQTCQRPIDGQGDDLTD